ncbi:TrmH family RNA methyltransferase [Roseiflexus sp.]|uniref:TrmH family RNA methyltransferase n=1 Tax=Roseiflexus sp. TaxID=2562120 RepID=UPI00398B0C1A
MAFACKDPNAILPVIIDLLHQEGCTDAKAIISSLFDAGRAQLRVFVSGWNTIDGVLAYRPETRFAATTRVLVAAAHERALRDLLLAAPRGDVLLFLIAGAWTLPTLAELFDGHEVAPRPPLDDPSVHLFVGVRRGSGTLPAIADETLVQGPPLARAAPPRPAGGHTLSSAKDPIVARLRDLGNAAGRRARGQFLAEGPLLTSRALDDLLVEDLFYTSDLLRDPTGAALLECAADLSVPTYRISEGLMGLITPTRPIPDVVSAIWGRVRDVADYRPGRRAVILVTEQINNPENLGMTLRTADAAGVEAVVVAGGGADPLHRECVRAARGAVGRIPIYACANLPAWIEQLRTQGIYVVGATGNVEHALYDANLPLPLAIIVGNETEGLTSATMAACSSLIRIPMAPGQDSLNVGVAAGVILYEIVRRTWRAGE